MKAWFLAALILTLLCGCGRAQRHVDGFETELSAFEEAARVEGRAIDTSNLVIEFGQVEPGKAANCQITDQGPIVQVKESIWTGYDREDREALIFHELGHCLLGRQHVADTLVEKPDGYWAPRSLMVRNCVRGQMYQIYRSDYVRELFHPVQ